MALDDPRPASGSALRIEPFEIAVPDAVLGDLRARLEAAHWPDDIDNADWSYGTNSAYLRELVDYWLSEYDWRAHERAMNGFPNYKAQVDGTPIHFIRQPGKGPNPIPLVLSHGWPWTHWFYHKLIGPLSDPAAYGGDPNDSFDVIVPSMPGFGFSTPAPQASIGFVEMADLLHKLMCEGLGYAKFGAAGGDVGAFVSSQLGHAHADAMHGVYLSLAPPLDLFHNTDLHAEMYEPDEAWKLERTLAARPFAIVHKTVQSYEPQTMAYAMHDSPLALCAWLVKRYRDWSDSGGDVERRFSKDDILTAVMIYWVTRSYGSSARFYHHCHHNPWKPVREGYPVVAAPTAVGLFPREVRIPARRWAERYYNLRQMNVMTAGGHFAAMEEPKQLGDDITTFFRQFRT